MSDKYSYQLNAYFCIYYPAEMIDEVLAAAANHPAFADLEEDQEVKIEGYNYVASTNSDICGSVTHGFIFVEEMTLGSRTESSPNDTVLHLEPSELDKIESLHAKAVNTLTDLHDILVGSVENKHKLNIGWSIINCAWEIDPESE